MVPQDGTCGFRKTSLQALQVDAGALGSATKPWHPRTHTASECTRWECSSLDRPATAQWELVEHVPSFLWVVPLPSRVLAAMGRCFGNHSFNSEAGSGRDWALSLVSGDGTQELPALGGPSGGCLSM